MRCTVALRCCTLFHTAAHCCALTLALQRALDWRRAAHGTEYHWEVAASVHELGVVALKRQRLRLAEKLLTRARQVGRVVGCRLVG